MVEGFGEMLMDPRVFCSVEAVFRDQKTLMA